MTLQVAKIVATTAATPYGTLQVASVKATAESAYVQPTTLQVASVRVASSTATQPPTATAGEAQTLDAGQTVTLTGTDTAPGGTITERHWWVVTGSVPLQGATTQAATYKAPASLTDQTITLGYTVTSSTGLTTQATVTHTIIAATERAIRGGVEVPAYIG